ncbi:MAG: SDR family NAD(P)-dependent oxidoreductase [Roseateles sp.]|jgi:3-hydroxybutyrate dehydrogenase|nr:SDR family oxidoreductase [Burkholderiaceae bacterium]|mmetsp:Transcript_10019/g.40741  ORF Transcript_10019/g.40741 Transcript_10019/m.40741 type:complete len:244 (+) Transcript_10019:1041-1772(+)
MKHAVITGGGSGIGAAVAQRLRADGLRVTLMGRHLDRLRAQQAVLGDAAVQVCDVADEASVAAAFAAVGEVDVLVNNAGQVETASFSKTSLDLWQRLLNVNLTGTFLCSRAVLPGMLARGQGRIVNVASTAALKGYAYVAAYCAAKHGVLGLTRALALEVAAKGVTVNAVCPGYTETDIVASAVTTIVAKTGRTPQQALAELAKANPQGRLIQPAEVAATVAWLVHSPGVNGQAIAVDGGETM